MHFLEMAFVGWETENWDRGGEKHTDKIIHNWVPLNEISL